MTEIRAPDAGLERVRLFLNTLDVEAGTDALDTPGSARAWLVEHDLPAPEGLTESDLSRIVQVREALRRFADAHHDGVVDAQAVATLNRLAGHVPLALQAREGTGFTLVPAGTGVHAALGVLLADVHAAAAAGTFPRLKVCPADDCRWAFYDRSRNRSRTWCAMEVCGNRAKARSYRARRHGEEESPPR